MNNVLEKLKSNKLWTESNGNQFYTVNKEDYEWLINMAEASNRYRHSLKRIRLATNWKEEDREEIIPHIYNEVNEALSK